MPPGDAALPSMSVDDKLDAVRKFYFYPFDCEIAARAYEEVHACTKRRAQQRSSMHASIVSRSVCRRKGGSSVPRLKYVLLALISSLSLSLSLARSLSLSLSHHSLTNSLTRSLTTNHVLRAGCDGCVRGAC